MSLYKDASLVMIPSAYKDGKLYSIRPTDGSGDFTFSRGSNLAATRVDVNGLIEKGRENLILQSNQFDTTWSAVNSSVTSGQSGYDGTNDAWLLTATSSGANIYQLNSSTGVLSLSVYAKANTANWIRLRFDNSSSADVNTWVNLSNGSIGSDSGIATNVEDIGGGWYRITSQANTSDLNNVRIHPADSDGNNSTSGSIYIQDAQLEQGLVATDYIETGASTAQAGILEDMPRLDYSGGASCPSLLLEPQRTNLLPYSELISAWDGYSATITENYATSPEGVQNAVRLEGTGSDFIRKNNIVADPSNKTYTSSFWAKQNGGDTLIVIQMNSSGITTYAKTINLTDEWQRFEFTQTYSASDTGSLTFRFRQSNTIDCLVYGFQVEEGSYPTSYIPTYGTSQTRSYDDLNDLDLDGLFNGNSYTILFDIDLNDTFNNKVFAEAKKSTGSSSFTFRNFNGLLRVYNNLDSTYLTGSIASDSSKWVVRIDGSTADVFSYNSGSPTKTSGTPLATIRDFGKINFSGGPTISSLNQFLIFPTALSDAECKSLVQ